MTSNGFDRRQLVLSLAAAGLSLPAVAQAAEWQTSFLKDAGFAKLDVIERLDAAVTSGKLKGIHSVAVVRCGKLVFDRYYSGKDEFWAMPIGEVKFGPTVKHDMRSATKSIVGLLYGIALSEGKVPGLDAVLIDQFPEYKDLASDPMRRRMKIRHVLSMTAGFEWPEDIPYTDNTNPELAMYLATDQFRYVLSKKMVLEPGAKWNYCGGCTALLGHLIAKGTGKGLFQYANEKLFGPLGITEVQWVGGMNGEVSAPSGLRMPARELAKIGQMILDNGRGGGRQIVPADWLKASFTPRAPMEGNEGVEYGYHWYILNGASPDRFLAARGNGGQFLFMAPSKELVVVVMAGNYNAEGAHDPSMAVIQEYVIDALGA